MTTCTIDGCTNPHEARGWCLKHYKRWRKTGNPVKIKIAGIDYLIPKLCTIEGCDRKHVAKGYCSKHWLRWKRRGTPYEVHRAGRPRGDEPTWRAIHLRLHKDRGRAKGYACVDCGGQAAEWSYDRADPNELIGPQGRAMLAYSLDPDHYEPRCVPCHRRFDRFDLARCSA
jgi:hypothetical protein